MKFSSMLIEVYEFSVFQDISAKNLGLIPIKFRQFTKFQFR